MLKSMSVAERTNFQRGLLEVFSVLQQRSALSAAMGKQFGGERDLYAELGYPIEIPFEKYEAMYKRQDIAGRVVDLPAQDTWRKPPSLIIPVEEEKKEQEKEHEFVTAVNSMARRLKLWHYLERVDRLAGIGRYGVLLIGVKGEADLKEEVGAEAVKGEDGVTFLAAFDEGSADVKEIESDAGNERFGLPKMYELDLGETGGVGKTEKKMVHWSRVIHVAEDLLEDEINGRPRLERVFNRMYDIEKVVGGGSEAMWRLVYQGMVLTTQKDYTKAGGEGGDDTVLEDELTEFVHGMRRILELEGFDVKFVGGEEVDPSGIFGIILSLIAGETGIPQRMLVGSERGELASTTDQASWAGAIQSRQTNFAEPMILRPFIDRLIGWGALPQVKEYDVLWPATFALNELEEAKLAFTIADALSKLAPPGAVDMIVDPAGFINTYLPKLKDAIRELEDLMVEEREDLKETPLTREIFERIRERALAVR